MRFRLKENSYNVLYLSARLETGIKFIVEKQGSDGIFHSLAFNNILRANNFFNSKYIRK